MKLFFLAGALFFASFISVHSQTADLFQNWEGDYLGTLYLDFPDKTSDSLTLKFEFHQTENKLEYVYKFTFESEKYGNTVKNYSLKLNEKFVDNQHFILDENNGILIDVVRIKNSLYSQYTVLKGIYSTRMTFSENGVNYEIICGKTDGGFFTASDPKETGEKYEVSSYLPFTVQQGYLHKLEK